jgi:hypothetical protein
VSGGRKSVSGKKLRESGGRGAPAMAVTLSNAKGRSLGPMTIPLTAYAFAVHAYGI